MTYRFPMIKKPRHVPCPICGGPENRMWFVGVSGYNVEFLVECCSGDTNVKSNYHLFLARIKIPREKVDIDAMRKLQEKLDAAEKMLEDQSSLRSENNG